MGTYQVTVSFDSDVDDLRLSEIYDALGEHARHGMTLTDGEPTSVGRDPVTFYLVIDDPADVGVAASETAGADAVHLVMARALLDARFTAQSARIDTASIVAVG